MKRHKWFYHEEIEICQKCEVCGIERMRRGWKRRMAIVGGRDYYQYGTQMAYMVDGEWTFKRPDCTPDINATKQSDTETKQVRAKTNPFDDLDLSFSKPL